MFNKTKSINFLFYGIALLILCLGVTAQVKAAVVIDNPGSSGGAFDNAGVTMLTFSHTVGDGMSRALFVGVSTSNTVLGPVPITRVTSVTYNGQMLTPIGSQLSPDFRNAVEMFRLNNPPSGTGNIVINLPIGLANYVVGGGTSFSGVSLLAPNGAFTSASGSSKFPTVIVNDSTTGDIVLDALAASPNALSFVPGLGQDLRYEGSTFFGSFDVGAGSTKAAVSPVTMSWEMSFVDDWALGAVAVKALGATAAGVNVSGRVLLPSGRGINRARVALTDSTGETRAAFTNPFGYYRFEDVRAGETYVFDVKAKHNSFASQVIVVNEETNELNFTAARSGKR
jgi:hypothetical protein